MLTTLQKLGARIVTVFIAAALLAYASWVVALVESSQTWSAIALAAIGLGAPVVIARAFGLRIVHAARERSVETQSTLLVPPLLGLELRIPDYQCEAFAQEVAALTGAGARVVAVDPAELHSISLVKPDIATRGGATALLTILRKDSQPASEATTGPFVDAPAVPRSPYRVREQAALPPAIPGRSNAPPNNRNSR